MNTILFDIETGPLPLAQLEKQMPTEWPTGNTKDPDKLVKAIEEKKSKWLADAALSPFTGRVLCIGLKVEGVFKYIGDDNEKELLEKFWRMVADGFENHDAKLVGFNIFPFDLPFLYGRSYANGVKVPNTVGWLNRQRWNWNERITDLRDVWQLGNRQAEGNLDSIAKLCGGTGKSGNGAEFAGLWASDRDEALAYLANDLNQTELVAERLLL